MSILTLKKNYSAISHQIYKTRQLKKLNNKLILQAYIIKNF